MKTFLITCVTLFVFAGEYDHAMNMVTECHVEFRVSNAGLDVTGYFDDVDVEINFNENKLHESHIVATARANVGIDRCENPTPISRTLCSSEPLSK